MNIAGKESQAISAMRRRLLEDANGLADMARMYAEDLQLVEDALHAKEISAAEAKRVTRVLRRSITAFITVTNALVAVYSTRVPTSLDLLRRRIREAREAQEPIGQDTFSRPA